MRHPVVTEDLAEIAAADLPFEELKGATVLVTGAAGMLASALVESLLYLNEIRSLDIQVLGLVRSERRAEERFTHYRGRSDLRLVEHDVSEPFIPPGPVHQIFHAASHASPHFFGTDPVGTLSPNVFGTRHLLELARARGAGFVFVSSGEIYGTVSADRVPMAETDYGFVDPIQVRSCYAESKRMGETLCVAWAAQHGVSAKIVRPFHTYGPGLSLEDGRVFADFVANVVRGEDLVLKSDGRAIRAYCYLADAVRGFLTVMLKGAKAEAYNVGNPHAQVSVAELAERLVALFPELHLRVLRSEAPRAAGYLESPIPSNAPRTEKLEALGWRPKHSIESGFSRTVLSFR